MYMYYISVLYNLQASGATSPNDFEKLQVPKKMSVQHGSIDECDHYGTICIAYCLHLNKYTTVVTSKWP